MKIGILTYHRAENYGALLQAYALMTYLSAQGYDVSFVDYWPKYHSDYFKLFSWEVFKRSSWKGMILMIAKILFMGHSLKKRKKVMEVFMIKRLKLTSSPRYTSNKDKTEYYDVVIYGSDQIWRKQQLNDKQFDQWYFGSENVLAKRKISYAGSMGHIETNEEDQTYIKNTLSKFKYVSVRELDLQNYFCSIGITSELVIDPVFLLSKEQWKSIEDTKKQDGKYILFYNLLNTSESREIAYGLSNITNLRIIEINKIISFYPKHTCQIKDASVEKFLSLIDNADYVISNSFHGVAFSIIFEKQFFACGMRQRANRVLSLLTSLGIEDRYFANYTTPSLEPINYQKVNECISSLKENSIAYLNKSLL